MRWLTTSIHGSHIYYLLPLTFSSFVGRSFDFLEFLSSQILVRNFTEVGKGEITYDLRRSLLFVPPRIRGLMPFVYLKFVHQIIDRFDRASGQGSQVLIITFLFLFSGPIY